MNPRWMFSISEPSTTYFLLFGTNLEVFFPPKKWGQQKNLVGPPSPPSGRGYKVGPFTNEIMGLQQLING